MFPKKNPEAAKKLLETPDEKLTNIERDKKSLLAVATMPMPCPMSVVDATDDTLELGGGNYIGECICLPELRDRAREGRAVLHGAGHAGLELAAEVPHPRPEEGQHGRYFSLQELEVLVVEHDAIRLLVEKARGRTGLGARVVVPEKLQFVTSAHLGAYLQARGWTIDEAGSDDVHRTWRKSNGGVC